MQHWQPNELLDKAVDEAAFTSADGDPFHVTFTVSGIEITGRIDSVERAEALMRAVNALKPLLRVTEQPLLQDIAERQVETRASVPFMITLGQKAKLKALRYSEHRIRDMTPQEAHDLLKNLSAAATAVAEPVKESAGGLS